MSNEKIPRSRLPGNGPTLNETLKKLGLTHKRKPGLSTYHHDIMRGKKVVFSGGAGDVWKWLKKTKQI